MFDASVLLVADADDRRRAFLAGQLSADGAVVHTAADSAQTRARAAAHAPDVLLLGRLDEHAAAMTLLRAIRGGDGLHGQPARDLAVVAMLEDEHDLAVLRAFDAGADDVTGRAVSYPVLRARVRALLARAGQPHASSIWKVGELEVDGGAREVRLRGRLVDLSAKEFALLSVLVAEPTRVFTKDELLRDVWAFRSPGRTRTLDSHACRLRTKLAAVGADRFVVNIWGVGYRLVDAAPVRLARAA